MSIVHQADNTVFRRIIQAKFARTERIGFQADAKHLGLEAHINLGAVIRNR